MSLRSGNNKKKGQKYQNTYAFKHNKGSMKTRHILSSPLDHLCERCLQILEWKLSYRKYKPLTAQRRCNICLEKTVLKAYRTICDKCAISDQNNLLCTKCGEKVEEYSKPNVRNDPSHGPGAKSNNPIMALVRSLKPRYQKSVYLRIREGIKIDYDETKGIINKETGDIIIDLSKITEKINEDDKNDDDFEEDEDKDNLSEEDEEPEENEDNNENEHSNKNIQKKDKLDSFKDEEINTSNNKDK